MEAKIATAALTGTSEKTAGSITEVFIQLFKDIYHLEDNLEALNENIKTMFDKLCHVCTRFQRKQRELPDLAENCITKMVDAVKKAKELSVRVEERRSGCFGCWNLCYPKLSTECREWNTKFDNLFKELDDAFQFPAHIEKVLRAAEAGPFIPQHVPVAGLVGLDMITSAERQVQEWLTQSPHRVVGVWGMGGVGKTSLLKLVNNNINKESRIFDVVIWVTVSQNFNVEGFYNSIAKALGMKLDEKIDSNRVRTQVCTSLEKKKFLLILDDVWKRIDFDEVGFSFGNHQGSRVLISTRSYDVIAQMGARECSCKMKPLSDEAAWELFKRKAFINGPPALGTNIEAIAREIAKECQGLPLAVNVVGAAMASRNTEEDWGGALDIMRSTDSSFEDIFEDIDEQLYQRLRYSYDVLSDKFKICFLYCAAFPEDAEINADRLVQIWIAEGVLTGKDLGYQYINELVKKCLIDCHVVGYSFNGTVERSINVHDVLRNMAIRIGKREKHCLFATNQDLTNFPREKEVSNCERISLSHNDIRYLLPQDLMKCPNLVSLLLASNRRLTHVPEPFLSSVMFLRVLDLSRTGIKGLPESVGELRLLEFLDLSHCPNLIELPESIGNLSALQFFNLSWTGIKGLPISVGELRLLEFLDLSDCRDLIELPESIGNLSALQFFNLSRTGIKGLPISVGELRLLEFLDLSHCPNLIELPESIGNLLALQFFNLDYCLKLKGLPSTIRGLKNLKQLTLDSFSEVKVNSDDIGQLTSLNRLVLPRFGAPLRTCDVNNLTKMRALEATVVTADGEVGIIDTLREIKELRLSFELDGPGQGVTINNIESVEILRLCFYKTASLPVCEFQNLKELQLHGCSEVRELPIQSFPMLEVLDLMILEKLDSLSGISEGSMPKIQVLRIVDCPMLMKLPSPMTLPSLQELIIIGCVSIKELDIGNDDFPKLKKWYLEGLSRLERITSSNGVWNEEAISQLEWVEIKNCPLLGRISSKRLIKLFKSNKMHWDRHVARKDEDNIDNDEDESIALEESSEDGSIALEESSEDGSIAHHNEDESIAPGISPREEYSSSWPLFRWRGRDHFPASTSASV